jgi:hypothetical protein
MIPSSTLSHLCERLLRLVPHGQAKSFILWKTDSRADGDLRPRNRVDYHPKGRAYAVPKNCCIHRGFPRDVLPGGNGHNQDCAR